MATNKTKGWQSPKNKFFASIRFDKYVKGIGGGTSVGADTLEAVEHRVLQFAQGKAGHVTIKENKADYPAFSWETVKEYNINK